MTKFGEISPLRLIFTVFGGNLRGLLTFGNKISNFGQIVAVGQILFFVNDQILNRKIEPSGHTTIKLGLIFVLNVSNNT